MNGKINVGQISFDYATRAVSLGLWGQNIAVSATDALLNLIITVPIFTIVLDSEIGEVLNFLYHTSFLIILVGIPDSLYQRLYDI